MKKFDFEGGFSSGQWIRLILCTVLAAVASGCGGGSDPLGISDDGEGSSSVDLRAAYDRVNQCGLTVQQTRKIVGREEDSATVYWDWYEERFSEKGKLTVVFNNRWDGHFEDTGVNKATSVRYEHPKNGVRLSKDLCSG